MTALADVPVAQAGPHAYREPGSLTHPGVSGGRYVCELLVSLSDSSAL